MILRVEHIGIAVKDMQGANKLFESLLGISNYKIEMVESENVATSFYKTGETKIELLESTSDSGPIAKFIEKKGQGIHHIAFETDDIVKEMERLKNLGFELLSDVPKKGADNKMIRLMNPKSTNGVLVELCQEILS